jgi:hypothetical protein
VRSRVTGKGPGSGGHPKEDMDMRGLSSRIGAARMKWKSGC